MLAGAWMRRRLRRTALRTWVGSSQLLKGTVFLPRLDCPLPGEHSAIWSVACQKARQEGIAEDDFQLPEGPLKIELSPKLISATLRLHFKPDTPLLDNDQPLLFQGVPVKSFGLRPADANRYLSSRQQVVVLFRTGAEFAVDPCLGSHPFRLVLAAVEPRETLRETIDYVRQRAAQAHEWRLGSRDSLLIPKQSWDVVHSLEGPPEARQRIFFRLDRSQVELPSPQVLKGLFTLAGRPCRYHFDRPFLLYLETREGGQVVLAMWVANPELLARWD